MRVLLACLLFAATLSAQSPVREVPDIASWGTAAVNPVLSAVRAARSSDPTCQFSRLLVSEGIGNGVSMLIKHFVTSPRPCAGCAADGMPSGHAMNSVIGVSGGWRYIGFSIGTAELRVAANRHTWKQVGAGLLLGAGAETAGRLLVHCSS